MFVEPAVEVPFVYAAKQRLRSGRKIKNRGLDMPQRTKARLLDHQ